MFIYEKITAVGYSSYTFLFVHISEKNFEKISDPLKKSVKVSDPFQIIVVMFHRKMVLASKSMQTKSCL